MAQVQRIDLMQNNFACAIAKFPATYPVFLSGKVTRDAFFADVEELNKIIATATAITRFYPVGFLICAIAFPISFFAIFTGHIAGAAIGVAFLIFFVGFAITGVGGCLNARQLSKAMSTDVPAAINRISPNYERHGVGLTLESYQTYSTYYDSGVGTGAATDTAIGRRGVTRTHYSLVVRDGEPVATGQVLGVAPPVNAVVGASAPPAPSGFCTQCGAPMKSDARFCGSCGAAR